MGFEDENIIIL